MDPPVFVRIWHISVVICRRLFGGFSTKNNSEAAAANVCSILTPCKDTGENINLKSVLYFHKAELLQD